jgi:hypothetical protein
MTSLDQCSVETSRAPAHLIDDRFNRETFAVNVYADRERCR